LKILLKLASVIATALAGPVGSLIGGLAQQVDECARISGTIKQTVSKVVDAETLKSTINNSVDAVIDSVSKQCEDNDDDDHYQLFEGRDDSVAAHLANVKSNSACKRDMQAWIIKEDENHLKMMKEKQEKEQKSKKQTKKQNVNDDDISDHPHQQQNMLLPFQGLVKWHNKANMNRIHWVCQSCASQLRQCRAGAPTSAAGDDGDDGDDDHNDDDDNVDDKKKNKKNNRDSSIQPAVGSPTKAATYLRKQQSATTATSTGAEATTMSPSPPTSIMPLSVPLTVSPKKKKLQL
jgi:hypothetical protein